LVPRYGTASTYGTYGEGPCARQNVIWELTTLSLEPREIHYISTIITLTPDEYG
jgi:hypothetical protein